MQNKFILNQVGYMPEATKKLIYTGDADQFQVMRMQDLKLIPVYTGKLHPVSTKDFFSNEKEGDFSDLKVPGIYRISASDGNSRCFLIGDTVYDTVERVLTNYFTWQRCCDDLGWNGCCHKNDRIVLHNGQERSLSGGHHQSSDLRKWVFGTSLGMIGYLKYALDNTASWGKVLFDEEIRHSLKYYLNLISDEGYVYDGTWVYEGYQDECRGVGYGDYSKAWEKRQFFESPAPEVGQWNVIRMLALASRFYKEKDSQLSKRCLDGAKKIYNYMLIHDLSDYDLPVYPPLGHEGMAQFYMGFYEGSALRLGNWTTAAIELYKAEPNENLKSDAINCLSGLTKLQIGSKDLCAGCFWEGKRSSRLANNYYYFFNTSVPFAFLGALSLWSQHKDASVWKSVIKRIADCNITVCQNNPYGRVAATWYTEGHNAFEKPGCWSFSTTVQPVHAVGKAGQAIHNGDSLPVMYEYESFCYNLDIIALGIFLHEAGLMFNNNTYIEYAQRQLDWMLGFNRFDASNVEGVGYNQPHRGIFGEFYPSIPQIPGGVFVGFTDLSFYEESFGYENEYDMPMVGWLMYLLRIIKTGNKEIVNKSDAI